MEYCNICSTIICVCHLFYTIFKCTIIVFAAVVVIIPVGLGINEWQWQKSETFKPNAMDLVESVGPSYMHMMMMMIIFNSMIWRRIRYLKKFRYIEIPQFEEFLFKRLGLIMALDENKKKKQKKMRVFNRQYCFSLSIFYANCVLVSNLRMLLFLCPFFSSFFLLLTTMGRC